MNFHRHLKTASRLLENGGQTRRKPWSSGVFTGRNRENAGEIEKNKAWNILSKRSNPDPQPKPRGHTPSEDPLRNQLRNTCWKVVEPERASAQVNTLDESSRSYPAALNKLHDVPECG